jgi:ribosomal protein S18 acetylase RimI-like enzyme
MRLRFRPAEDREHQKIQDMVIDSFEPITWFKKLDAQFGPLNGRDWRMRWEARMRQVFEKQMVLVGETDDGIAAMSSGTIDQDTALAYIDLLAVDRQFQGRGYGKEMLRGMMQHMKDFGAQYVNLDCLTDNDTANALYRAEGFAEIARLIRWFRKI